MKGLTTNDKQTLLDMMRSAIEAETSAAYGETDLNPRTAREHLTRAKRYMRIRDKVLQLMNDTTTHSTQTLTLNDFGDVLTDRELAQLLQRPTTWPRDERHRAERAGMSPNLPPELPGFDRKWGRHRYRKQDIAHWLQTGSRARRGTR